MMNKDWHGQSLLPLEAVWHTRFDTSETDLGIGIYFRIYLEGLHNPRNVDLQQICD